MEFVFGFAKQPYLSRARMVTAVAPAPARWLDVGAGHGHFCIAAREAMPATHFDGLDLSDSIDEAARRGWVEHAYRGLFPELAPTFAGGYDVVSMSHYLEHTLDQRAELAAAHTALVDGGCLMIELPDPDYVLGRVLGALLAAVVPAAAPAPRVGEEPRQAAARARLRAGEWHRGKAHQRVDFFFAGWLLLDRIAPPRAPAVALARRAGWAWRPRRGRSARR